MQISKEKKIKIAIMSYPMDNRKAKGTALYTRKLIENILADDRFDFYLVHYDKVDDPLYAQAKEIMMPKIKLPYGSHFVSQMLFFWKYRKNKFDIIHWFQPRVYPFFWLAPAKKIAITTHGAGNITAANKFIFSREVFNFILTKFVRKVDAIIAVSKYGCEEIEEYYHAPRENIFFTYCGGGEDFKVIPKTVAWRVIFKKYGVNQPFILGMARHLPHKNVTGLISAYKIFRDKYNRNEKLVIVGTRDFDTEKIFKLADKSGYKSDIIFINYVEADDLNHIYSAADLLVFPSFVEGFGLPVIEAMASGTPVITSNTTSLPEVAGGAAVLINPLDVAEIAAAIHKVLSDENFKESLIAGGLEQSHKFSWTQTAEQTKEIYFKLFENI
ncbi:MAG: glycosyltransferase family 1 protein [Patescibacteria group bacterium]|jgi:glycosyltransferase involved in cell wall biosynthesis